MSVKIRHNGVVVSGIMLAMNLSGCSFFVKKDSGNTDIQSVRQESENADKTVMKRSKSEEKEAEEILEICSKTYAKAEKEGKLDDLEMIRDLIKELGEKPSEENEEVNSTFSVSGAEPNLCGLCRVEKTKRGISV